MAFRSKAGIDIFKVLDREFQNIAFPKHHSPTRLSCHSVVMLHLEFYICLSVTVINWRNNDGVLEYLLHSSLTLMTPLECTSMYIRCTDDY